MVSYTASVPMPKPTVISQSASSVASPTTSNNITRLTKSGGKKNTQYGGVKFTAPVVPTKFNSVAGSNSQQNATNMSVTGNIANVQSTNDVGSTDPLWNQQATSSTTTGTTATTGGGRRRKSRKYRKTRKSRKSRKSRRHKRRNTYKK